MMETLQNALAIVHSLPVVTPCDWCDHWADKQCTKYGAVPPQEVQATGCPEWVEGIPF